MRLTGLSHLLAAALFAAATVPVLAADRLVLRSQVVMDTQGTGTEAFRLLVPDGWSFDGGLAWNVEKFPAEPYTAYRVVSPARDAVFEQFPHVTLFWSDDPLLQQSHAQNGIDVMQPAGAEQALRDLYIASYRPEATQVELVELQPLPELARETVAWNQALMRIFDSISPFTFAFEIRADSARARYRYVLQGTPMVEDVTVTVSYFIAYVPTLSGRVPAITWSASPTSLLAPAAAMDRYVDTFRIIAASRRDNPAWHEHVTRLAAVVTREQLRQQRAIFERLQQIRRTQAETSDIIMQAYERRSQAHDRIFENYSRSLRGVESYADPINDRRVALPGGYGTAWTNGSDYVLSNEAGFNPNVGSSQTWVEMQPHP